MSHRWTASFAYNLFHSIRWERVATVRNVVDVERE